MNYNCISSHTQVLQELTSNDKLGQHGKVFRGRYKRSEGAGYLVAVKTIKKYESEKEKDNFLKEMNIMSRLMHPNIVRLFGLVQQGKMYETPYLSQSCNENFILL